MRRLVVAGAVVMLAGVVGLGWTLYRPPGAAASLPKVPAPPWWTWTEAERGEEPATSSARGLGWHVVNQVSAHGVLIVTVETHQLEEALTIARSLVEPVQARYGEVLIYFRRPRETFAVKRVQWVSGAGFDEFEMGRLPKGS